MLIPITYSQDTSAYVWVANDTLYIAATDSSGDCIAGSQTFMTALLNMNYIIPMLIKVMSYWQPFSQHHCKLKITYC